MSAGLGVTPAQLQATWQSLGPLDSQPRLERLLKDVAAWLVVNSMRSEKVQFNLLCEQTATNVWLVAIEGCTLRVAIEGCAVA